MGEKSDLIFMWLYVSWFPSFFYLPSLTWDLKLPYSEESWACIPCTCLMNKSPQTQSRARKTSWFHFQHQLWPTGCLEHCIKRPLSRKEGRDRLEMSAIGTESENMCTITGHHGLEAQDDSTQNMQQMLKAGRLSEKSQMWGLSSSGVLTKSVILVYVSYFW